MSMLLTKRSHTKELEINKKRKKPEENTPVTWKRNISPHSREYFLIEGRGANQFDKRCFSF